MARLCGILTYSRIERLSVRLYGEWMPQAGFINGMGVTFINQKKVKAWLKTFPGALNDTGDIPVIKRSRLEGGI
ncbi:type I toxin-antitoxin system SymE family toxin [Salmonella enterica]|nr:type I toxin-antitoxin system SymE family toxin [Salmonella enterica]EBO8570102.1 type I toxin-antitoxin system SymE family toxin [Salmonella enterica]EBS9253435.1 type I toxin-antitoxin system SymE family toxin [Salmonella enterica]EDS4365336.1 type I toxin-antitoxin system SymE family toxin [Salmonella enterica subsp. enterica serovar Inverness]ELJ3957690.1 type I toxin-antitoxin system SymE family toxin [Salmonella enterica]